MFYVQKVMPGPPQRYISLNIDAWTSPKCKTHLNAATRPRKSRKNLIIRIIFQSFSLSSLLHEIQAHMSTQMPIIMSTQMPII
jgi:hypothetical protein